MQNQSFAYFQQLLVTSGKHEGEVVHFSFYGKGKEAGYIFASFPGLSSLIHRFEAGAVRAR